MQINSCIECAFLCSKRRKGIDEVTRNRIVLEKDIDNKKIVDTRINLHLTSLRCFRNMIDNRQIPFLSYREIQKLVTQSRFDCFEWKRNHNGQSPHQAAEEKRYGAEMNFKQQAIRWQKWQVIIAAIAIAVSLGLSITSIIISLSAK